MTTSFTLPLWYDLHAHFRQEELLKPVISDHIAMGCAGILAMPNTKPPVAKVFADDAGDMWSIEKYHAQIAEASKEQLTEIIVPLYLTQDTTAEMILRGAKSGKLKACKYYPPHGTTGAEFGAPFDHFIDNGVFAAMQDHGIILCIHGEQHNLEPETYFDRTDNAEEIFYRTQMPRLIEAYPTLKIVGEHLTTKIGVDFILNAPPHVKASITPQHLLYTVGHLLQGCRYHLYCLPLLKHVEDRTALRAAISAPDNDKFFAGTDSAPHTNKVTPCGCAAGCYTGGIAPQLYAQAFEEADVDLSTTQGQKIFEQFLCNIGRDFYALPIPEERFTLTKIPQTVQTLNIGSHKILPLPVGLNDGVTATIPWSLTR